MKRHAAALLPFLFLISGCAAPPFISAISGGWTTYQIAEHVEKKDSQKRILQHAQGMDTTATGSQSGFLDKKDVEQARILGFRCHPVRSDECRAFIKRVSENEMLRKKIQSFTFSVYLEHHCFNGATYMDIDARASNEGVMNCLNQ